MIPILAALTVLAATRIALNARGSLDDHLFMLNDAGVEMLIYDPVDFGDHVAALTRQMPALTLVPMRGDAPKPGLCDLADGFDARPLTLDAIPAHDTDDLALIGYTGGTTGRPKGVRSTNRVQAWTTVIQMAAWDWPDEVRSCVVTPLRHSGMVVALPTWLRGGAIHVLEGHVTPQRFFECVARHRITTTLVVPTQIYAWLDDPRLGDADLSSLDTVFYGSAPMSPSRLAEAIRRMGNIFSQFYGQSEAPMTVCTMPKRDHRPDDLARLASCGRPVPWVEVSLRDEDGAEVAPGTAGEICVRGPLVMDGYHSLPAETAAVLRDGWLRTGDIARRGADGFLTIVDRSKDMIITGGFNVYAREVEDVLAAHPAVSRVAVIGLTDPRWGETVRAVVVCRAGVAVSEDELISLVKAAKGSVAAPKAVDFVDDLPLSPVGKIDKKALRARYQSR